MAAGAKLSLPAFIFDIQTTAENLVNVAHFERRMLEVRLCDVRSKKSNVVVIASGSAA